ncbi:MAG: transposase [bacterium]
MARIARVVAPGIPHQITQCGNRRQEVFFCDADYKAYLALVAEWCARRNVTIWAYCLMPNHVHLIAVPESEDGLRRAIGETHRRYTRQVNFREGWRGHLWECRFASFPMDEKHVPTAMRYMELNPVRAGLVAKPDDYLWSSAKANLERKDNALIEIAPMLKDVENWERYLTLDPDEEETASLRRHERTGRPLGDMQFLTRLENTLGRTLRKRKPGPKPQNP